MTMRVWLLGYQPLLIGTLLTGIGIGGLIAGADLWPWAPLAASCLLQSARLHAARDHRRIFGRALRDVGELIVVVAAVAFVARLVLGAP